MYYNIKTRTDKEVGNVFPQVECLNQELAHKIKSNRFVKLENELLYILDSRANLTKVLSQIEISSLGFLINEDVRDILKKFKIITHNFNEAIIKDYDAITYRYYWLHLGEKLEDLEWLDYENSTFFVEEYGFRTDDISITSYEDFIQKAIEVGDMAVINIEKIQIKSGFFIDSDMFIIPRLTRNIFISQKLKVALEEYNITGILTEEAFR